MRLLGAVHWLQSSSSRQPATTPAMWMPKVPLGGELAGNVIADDPGEYYRADAPPPTTIARVWAPDHLIKQLTGPLLPSSSHTMYQHFNQ